MTSIIGAGTGREAYNKDPEQVARRHQQIFDRYGQGASPEDIAQELEITEKHVRRILLNNGEEVSFTQHVTGTDSIWDMDDDARRIAFARRAQRGARKALGMRDRLSKQKAPEQPVSSNDVTITYAQPKWLHIVNEVSAKHDVTVKDMLGRFRDSKIVTARHEAIWRIRNETTLSLPQIGQKFGRDHTTILHSYRQHEKRLAAQKQVQP